MYKVINPKDLKRKVQYDWFSKFLNPTYSFNVDMDVTKLVEYSKLTKTSFFVNFLFIVTKSLNEVPEMRYRIVKDEIRLYDIINPTYTVMTIYDIYVNSGIKMDNDYHSFYKKVKDDIEVKKLSKDFDKEEYNDSNNYDDYYMTCVPFIGLTGMTHPLPIGDKESLSVPRVCWDKYRNVDNKYLMNLNITVSHVFVDGKPLSLAYTKIQNYLDNLDLILK